MPSGHDTETISAVALDRSCSIAVSTRPASTVSFPHAVATVARAIAIAAEDL
jgi:hypothetical protein